MKIKFRKKPESVGKVKRIEPKVVVDKDASPKNNIPLLKKLLKGWEVALNQIKGESIGENQKKAYYRCEISSHKARIRILEATA